jgi:hypothetical protein
MSKVSAARAGVLLPTRAQNANSIQARMRVPPEEMFVVMRCGPAAARRMFAFR